MGILSLYYLLVGFFFLNSPLEVYLANNNLEMFKSGHNSHFQTGYYKIWEHKTKLFSPSILGTSTDIS